MAHLRRVKIPVALDDLTMSLNAIRERENSATTGPPAIHIHGLFHRGAGCRAPQFG